MAPRRTTTTKLHAVPAADPTAVPKDAPKPTTVEQATEGSRRDVLVAQRARLAKAVDSPATSPRDLAPLSRQLLQIDEEIRAIDAAASKDGLRGAAATPDDDWDASAI